MKGAGNFHSAGQSKEGYVGFGTSEHPIFMKLLPDQGYVGFGTSEHLIFMKLLPDHLWH